MGGSRDVLCGLTREQIDEARERTLDTKRIPEDDARFVMSSPLLLLYLVRGQLGDKTFLDDSLILPALALHFPGERDPNARKRYVRYRLNRIAQQEEAFGLFDDEPAVDEDIDD
ncbi:MAG: hypothetical protein H6844_11535 [Alphaproteobacteria bacterium]|nr:hypothetical protein [Alphaproteobacteria bacterium]